MDTLTVISKIASKLKAGRAAYSLLAAMPITPPGGLGKITADGALDLLHSIHPDTGGSCVVEPVAGRGGEEYDLDVIIPVYNVERYVGECVESVLGQRTGFSFHVTIVNDGSTDSSRSVLKKYEGDPRVNIIDQGNKGFSGARNTGLANVKGRYIMFVDSDDRLPQGAVDALMGKAAEGGYDIVGGGHVRFDSRGIVDRQVPAALTGFAWGKVYKAGLWRGIRFPEGYWFEDTINAFLFNIAKHSTATVGQVVYEWRRNTASISFSSRGKPKILDTVYVTLRLLADRERLGLAADDGFRRTLLHQFKVNAVRTHTLGDRRADYANFVVSKSLYDKYLAGEPSLGNRHKELAAALARDDYKRFLLASLLL